MMLEFISNTLDWGSFNNDFFFTSFTRGVESKV